MYYSKESHELSQKEKYFLLIGAVAPRPIAWVSTISKKGDHNIAPFSFFNAFSADPPIVIFSPATSPDPERPFKDTYLNLIETNECVINMVNYDLREKMNQSSQDLSREESEFEAADIETVESDLVKPLRVKTSPVQMECKLREMRSFGEQAGAGNLAICEVIKFHIQESVLKEGTNRIDTEKIDLIGRNGSFYYTRAAGEALFEIKRP